MAAISSSAMIRLRRIDSALVISVRIARTKHMPLMNSMMLIWCAFMNSMIPPPSSGSPAEKISYKLVL